MGFLVSTIRVMIVDDNAFLRETVAGMLREIGFREIYQAGDGNDALRQLPIANPGLIICDVEMKPMNGLDFVDSLRKHSWTGAKDIPVIFLTGHSVAPIVKAAAKLGAAAYMVKPVNKKQLHARVMTVLENALSGGG